MFNKSWLYVSIALLLLSACNAPQDPAVSLQATQAAAQAVLTEVAGQSGNSESGDAQATICDTDTAEFLQNIYADVPVRNGSSVHPHQAFTVTWLVRNSGNCIWSPDYMITLIEQQGLASLPVEVRFPQDVLPGEEVRLTVELVAPATPGDYSAVWVLTRPNGETLAVSGFDQGQLDLVFSVLQLPEGWNYDFLANHCQAQWHSDMVSFLPCQGDPETDWHNGFVLLEDDPALEHRSANNPPVLWVRPNNTEIGFIRAIYPAYTVQNGDIFMATIGCTDKLPKCKLTYLFRYIDENGDMHNLSEWFENSNGRVQDVRFNLSNLAGETVQIVLEVLHYPGTHRASSSGFWMMPRIENP